MTTDRRDQQLDVTNCEREPIHIPGAVQPHGALLVVRASNLKIVQCSASVATILGTAPLELLDKPVNSIIAEPDVRALLSDAEESHASTSAATASADEASGPPRSIFLSNRQVSINGHSFETIAHRSQGMLIIELEPLRSGSDGDHDEVPQSQVLREFYRTIERTRLADSLETLGNAAAEEVRRITGFDRVMVYRFDENFNGAVIAESKRDDLEPFLGLNYPASDIPAQARSLYVRNRLRFITNRDYVPSPLIPVNNPVTGRPLDLSHSVLRSVSPIHLEYLRNMDVSASMSVSIVTPDGRLWGLIACHHYSGPRFVVYNHRRACEMIGEMISLQLVAKQEFQNATYAARMNVVVSQLGEAMDHETDVAASLTQRSSTIADLFECGGAAIIFGDRILTIGRTPDNALIRDLVDWLDSRHEGPSAVIEEIFCTDSLASQFPRAAVAADVGSGLIAAALTRAGRNYMLWFRPELVRTVDWAGDPEKSVVKGDDGVRLSPRGSFALWKQTVRQHSKPWTAAERGIAAELRRQVIDRVLRSTDELKRLNSELSRGRDEANAARSQAEAANRVKDQFLATLSHELRTPLNAILGWSNLLSRGERDPQELGEGLEIIERNARAQSKLIEDLLDVSRIVTGKLRLEPVPTDLAHVVEAAAASVRVAADSRSIRLRLNIEPDAGQVQGDSVRLQQIFWNLFSNAVKFTPKGGEVRIDLRRVDSSLELVVRDTGIGIEAELLPHVFDRFKQSDSGSNRKYGGLGLGLAIVRHLVELHGGTVAAASAGLGLGSSFTVRLPLMPMRRDSVGSGRDVDNIESSPSGKPRRVHACPADLNGLRIMVVEDEADSRRMLVCALQDCEATVIAAESAAEAFSLLAAMSAPPEIIISDIGMPDMDGIEMIKRVRQLTPEQGGVVPAIALTAYASADDRRRSLAAGFQSHLPKPISPNELVAVVANLVGRSGARP